MYKTPHSRPHTFLSGSGVWLASCDAVSWAWRWGLGRGDDDVADGNDDGNDNGSHCSTHKEILDHVRQAR